MFGIAQSDFQTLCAFCTAYGTVHILLAAFLKGRGEKGRAWQEAMEYSDLVLSVPFHFFCALPAMYVTYELRNDRVWGRHWMARQIAFAYIAKNIQNSFVLITDLWGKPTQRRSTLAFLAHHSASVFSYLLLVRDRHADFYASMALISETTNFFLVYLTYVTGFNRGLKKSHPNVYCVNGACLWFSFVPCRLVLFPTWLYLWFSDWVELRKGFTAFAMYYFVGVIVLLFILSAIWFRSITLGLVKALGMSSPVETEKTAALGGERYGQGDKEE
jgi:hypothetical protein